MLALFVGPITMIIKFSVLCTICITLEEGREEKMVRGVEEREIKERKKGLTSDTELRGLKTLPF